MKKLLTSILFLTWASQAWAASCCGGGGSASLIIPKFMPGAVKATLEQENYHGFWNQNGDVIPDPDGSKLQQNRLGFGAATRVNDNWQANISTSLVDNQNRYSGNSSHTQGLGDSQIGLLYENFDQITCVYEIHRLEDWKPASYFGINLLVPTGLSPYDDVDSSFDITGRGFYRLEGTASVEKTIYPLTASLNAAYGTYMSRMVNQETGNWVAPYEKKLGDRQSMGAALGYTWFMENIDQLTLTVNLSRMQEANALINGAQVADSNLKQTSWGWVFTYMQADQNFIFNFGVTQGMGSPGLGENFPVTKTISLGVSHVFHQ